MYLRKRRPKTSCYSPAPDARIGLPVTQPTCQTSVRGMPCTSARPGREHTAHPGRDRGVIGGVTMDACSVARFDLGPRLAGSLSRSQPRA